MVKLLPYKIGSQSAKILAQRLGVKRIIPGGRYTPPSRAVVINWGNSAPHFHTTRVVNHPSAVAIAKNKLATFRKLEQMGVPHVPFTTSKEKVHEWLTEGYRAVCRHLLESNSGQGIQILHPSDDEISMGEDTPIPYAPLYTKYMKKQKEYRIHVFNDQVIDAIEKRKRNGASEDEGHQSLIRNHENGWVFCRDGVVVPENVKDIAINAVIALGLDFGAVDIVWNNGRAYVLEVNTAPGLSGSTVDSYVNAIRRMVMNETT